MTIDEHVRLRLYQWCLDHMEPDLANAMMQAIPPTNWSDLATKADLDLATRELRSETAELGTSLRLEMGELRADLRTEMAQARGETQLALASQLRLLVTLILGSTFSLMGLILATSF